MQVRSGVSVELFLRCDNIVHWITNLAQFIASLQQVQWLVGTDQFPNWLSRYTFVNPSGEHTTLAVFTNGSTAFRRDDEVIHIDDVIGTSCFPEGRIDAYQRISHRAGQIRRVSRGVVGQGDLVVHWSPILLDSSPVFNRLIAGWNRLVLQRPSLGIHSGTRPVSRSRSRCSRTDPRHSPGSRSP